MAEKQGWFSKLFSRSKQAGASPQDANRSAASVQVTAAWQPGAVLLGDFVVEKQLGAGGMGTVYLVAQPDQQAAIRGQKSALALSGNAAAPS